MSAPTPTEMNPESARRGFEVADAHARPLAWLALVLALMAGGTMLMVVFLQGAMTDDIERGRDEVHPMADFADRPVGPLLQDLRTRETDLTEYRAQQEAASGYGWIAPSEGVVHLPPERAMDLMLRDQAFPHRDSQQ